MRMNVPIWYYFAGRSYGVDVFALSLDNGFENYFYCVYSAQPAKDSPIRLWCMSEHNNDMRLYGYLSIA